MFESKIIFYIGSLGVTSAMTTMVAITVLTFLLCFFVRRRFTAGVPHGIQNVLEKIVEMIEDFLADLMGREMARRYFPLLASLFLFIIISNYCGLLPFSGEVDGFKAPTSSFSVTAGLAIIVFVATHYYGFKAHHWSYLKHFCKPVALLLPLMLIEELVRPLSLSLRLFGNIFGDEMVANQFFGLMPALLPVPVMFLGLLMGLIQAAVFMILAAVYISGAAGTEE